MNEPELVRRFYQATSLAELEKMYRTLSKHTHPDLTGGDDGNFKILHRVYQEARSLLLTRGNGPPDALEPDPATVPPDPFDPWTVILELGFSQRLPIRSAHIVSLYRFHSAGLSNSKLRNQDTLSKRNSLILKTVYHWGGLHDPGFPGIFTNFIQGVTEGLMPTAFLKASRESKRFVEEGFSHYYRYQQEGRSMSQNLARRSLEDALDTIDVYRLQSHPVEGYARWLLQDLDKDPGLVLP